MYVGPTFQERCSGIVCSTIECLIVIWRNVLRYVFLEICFGIYVYIYRFYCTIMPIEQCSILLNVTYNRSWWFSSRVLLLFILQYMYI